ncbi:vWA domain-containing protein [Hamadaea tsunoensis]|uniref:vWA domain-containing protein n=1 Tax=Hamadaea tsunoensis TaxID=53368 RepID=UPI0003FD5581|nr:vWA domain-containing protein [Hamadaea tsunoensis]
MRALRSGLAAAVGVFLAGTVAIVVDPAPTEGAPSPTNATMTLRVGGDRTTAQAVDGPAGAVFDVYPGVSGTPPTLGSPTYSCTTTAPTGTCSVDVAARTGTNQGYWIVERTAPAGYAVLQTVDTGPGPTVARTYNQFFTGTIQNNVAYQFPTISTGNTNPLAREDTWADVRTNPPLPDHCGLNIALLIDVSGSIAPDLPAVKDAADGFVDALTGTPSRIGVFSFATGANQILGATSVSAASGGTTVKDAVAGLTAGGGTNWDSGLFQVFAATTRYDAVLMLTDGNPTFYGPNSEGPGNYTRFREVENGVFSANALKNLGTRIVAVGVGAGISGSANNLQAISGPTAGSDYVQTDYAQLGQTFRDIALKTCSGTISVVKNVISPTGTIADGVPTGGWTFATATSGVTPASGSTDNTTGALSFDVDLAGATTKSVTITETQQAGYALEQVGGLNATCTSDGNPVTVTNSGALGFTVDALANGIVTCSVYNRAPVPQSTVQVNKVWRINGTDFPFPSQPTAFQAALGLTGQTTPIWSQVYGGYVAGDSVTVGDTPDLTLLPPGCTVTPSGDLGAHTLAAGANVYAVLNTVTCTTTLTLIKQVVNPYGPPDTPADSWVLSAYPTGDPNPLFGGTTGVSNAVTADTRYLLGETTVAGYRQEVNNGAVIVAPSTGSWHCSLRQRDGTLGPEYDGLNGGVTVQLGQQAECTARNIAQPALVTLRKLVDNPFGGTAGPRDWELQADPGDGERARGLGAVLFRGRDGDAVIIKALAIPTIAYALSESGGPAGYDPVGVPECVLTGTTTTVPTPGGVLTPEIGQDITCTMVNIQASPSASPSESPSASASPSGSATPPPSGSATPSLSPSPPPIPVTGVAVRWFGGLGLLAIVIGVGLLIVARRQRYADGDEA